MQPRFMGRLCRLRQRGKPVDCNSASRRTLGREKVARLVRRIAKRLSLRLAAATEGDGRLINGNLKLIASRVDDRDRSIDQERPVITHFNRYV